MIEFKFNMPYRDFVEYLKGHTSSLNWSHCTGNIGMSLRKNVILLQKNSGSMQQLFIPRFRGELFSIGKETKIVGRIGFPIPSVVYFTLYCIFLALFFPYVLFSPPDYHVGATLFLCFLTVIGMFPVSGILCYKSEEVAIVAFLEYIEEKINEENEIKKNL